jgi:ElaB/YqjD/DUF883 family membrane-anchored ribosome-binding protein
MDRAIHEFDRAADRMAGDLRTMITDSEDLLNAAVSVSGESFAAARARFEGRLKSARAALEDASRPLVDRTREGAASADGYVRANPWSAVGVALAAGALVGFLAAKR